MSAIRLIFLELLGIIFGFSKSNNLFFLTISYILTDYVLNWRNGELFLVLTSVCKIICLLELDWDQNGFCYPRRKFMFVSFKTYRFGLQMFRFSFRNYIFEHGIINIWIPKEVIFKLIALHGWGHFILKQSKWGSIIVSDFDKFRFMTFFLHDI